MGHPDLTRRAERWWTLWRETRYAPAGMLPLERVEFEGIERFLLAQAREAGGVLLVDVGEGYLSLRFEAP